MSTAADLVRVRRMVATGVARQIRMEAGLSQAELANAVGVHKMTLSNGSTKGSGLGARRPSAMQPCSTS